MAKSKTIVYVRDDETAFLNVDVLQKRVAIPAATLASWRRNRTPRYSQVAEVLRIAFGVKGKGLAALKHNLQEIYLNITDEEMRRALNGVGERRRQLRLETTSNEGGVEDRAVGQ